MYRTWLIVMYFGALITLGEERSDPLADGMYLLILTKNAVVAEAIDVRTSSNLVQHSVQRRFCSSGVGVVYVKIEGDVTSTWKMSRGYLLATVELHFLHVEMSSQITLKIASREGNTVSAMACKPSDTSCGVLSVPRPASRISFLIAIGDGVLIKESNQDSAKMLGKRCWTCLQQTMREPSQHVCPRFATPAGLKP